MNLARPALVLGIIEVFCLQQQATGTEFASPTSYAVGSLPLDVAVGDLNGDGKPDIAVVNSGSNDVSVLLGNGDGTFQPATNFDVGNSMTNIAVGDFNGDGKLDIVVFLPGKGAQFVAGELRILLGNGDGTFQAPVVTPLTIAATSLRVGDFNGDKKADLIVGNVDTSTQAVTLNILIGNGNGTFQAAKAIASEAANAPQNAPLNFLILDFNADGRLDLAIIVSAGVQILLGKGDGTFQSGATAVLASGFTALALLTADFNGDAKPDLIVNSFAFSSSSVTPQHVSVFLGHGDGSFGSEQVIFSGSLSRPPTSEISNLWTGDFNGDGKSDLLDIHLLPNIFGFGVESEFELRLSKGDGLFSLAIVLQGLTTPAIVQDLNGDKLDDFIGINSTGSEIEVVLNTSPASGADLGILGAEPSGNAGQGENLTYFAHVLNEGPQAASNVTFTDALPSGVTFVSATSSAGSCTDSNLTVTCSIGSLAEAADAQVTIVVVPTTIGTITNKMGVSATEPDSAQANNSATQAITVVPVYTLIVIKNGAGTGTVESSPDPQIKCGSVCSGTYLSGTVVDLTVLPDPGSSFQTWVAACPSNTTPCAVTMNADTTVAATFVTNPVLTVKIVGSGAGTVTSNFGSLNCSNTGGTCSYSYTLGSAVSLAAVVSGNSVFGGWSGACAGTDPSNCTITVNSDTSVTATFNPGPDFTISPAATSLSLKRGGQVSDTLTFATQGGFNGAIGLVCAVAGTAPTPTCGISPNSVTPGSSATLTVSAANLTAGLKSWQIFQPQSVYAACLPLVFVGCAMATASDRKRRRLWSICLLLLGALLPAACGNGTSPPVAQSYVVTVSASSGSLLHGTTITVTVQ